MADERTVYHTHPVGGPKNEGETWQHDHPGGDVEHDHAEMKKEALKAEGGLKNQKSSETADTVVETSTSAIRPAGYDEHGNPLATEKERREANTEEKSQKLADSTRGKDPTRKNETTTKTKEG